MNEQPPTQSVLPPAEEPPTVSTPPTTYQPDTTAPAMPVAEKKRSLLWLWILLGVLGTLVAALLAVYVFVYPSFMATTKATTYMIALKESNDTVIDNLSDLEPNDPFLISVEKGLKGSSFTHVDTTAKGSTFLVRFDVTNSQSIKDTSLKVENGKITALLLNTRTTSSKSSSSSSSSNTDATEEKTATTSEGCLVLADLTNAGETIYEGTPDSSFKHMYEMPMYYDMVFFESDSSTPSYEPTLIELGTRAEKLYKALPDKKYTFQIIGSVNESSSSDAGKKLALERADVIKNVFTKAGIPESKITISQPINETAADNPEIYRRVDVNLQSDASCDIAW